MNDRGRNITGGLCLIGVASAILLTNWRLSTIERPLRIRVRVGTSVLGDFYTTNRTYLEIRQSNGPAGKNCWGVWPVEMGPPLRTTNALTW